MIIMDLVFFGAWLILESKSLDILACAALIFLIFFYRCSFYLPLKSPNIMEVQY